MSESLLILFAMFRTGQITGKLTQGPFSQRSSAVINWHGLIDSPRY